VVEAPRFQDIQCMKLVRSVLCPGTHFF